MKNIAHLGNPGSFSFIAAQKYFGEKAKIKGFKSVKDVFENLIDDKVLFGVVPVENSTTGSILETYDELMNNKMHICGEILLKIHHHLLVSSKKTKLNLIRTCYSHPQAISQCESFFENHKKIRCELTSDTATAAMHVARRKKPAEAAIASKITADIYGLRIIKYNIEDNENNFTRFFIIGKSENTTGTKASIVFCVKHIPGSLFMALRSYAGLGLNLTKIESRPLFRKAWEYVFFVDFEITNNLASFNKMIREMKNSVEFVRVLGLYNKGKTYET